MIEGLKKVMMVALMAMILVMSVSGSALAQSIDCPDGTTPVSFTVLKKTEQNNINDNVKRLFFSTTNKSGQPWTVNLLDSVGSAYEMTVEDFGVSDTQVLLDYQKPNELVSIDNRAGESDIKVEECRITLRGLNKSYPY